ncbi:hypothetical protein [Clostridium sp. 2218st1_F5_2218SCRN_220325]|uniref:hypothetical protein n=1 Tax=Clostridium sp. 2218st1_F5_2218SCRN_220325 TaxID=3143056 RepID=UPI00319E5053
MQIAKSKNIYLLSERGCVKLVKIMDTDLAKDVAEWIEHKNPSKMIEDADDDEKLIAVCDVTNSYTTSKSRNIQEMWLLTEDGAIR